MVLSSNHNSFKKSVFVYLKVTVMIDAINLIITSGSSLTLSQTFKNNYWIQFYYLYMVLYFSKVLQMTSSFVKIKLSADRLEYLRKKSKRLILFDDQSSSKKIKIHVLIFFVFASIFQSPSLFAYTVSLSNGTSKIDFRDFIKDKKIVIHILEHTIPIGNLMIMLAMCIRMCKVLYYCNQYDLNESIELKKITKTASTKIINEVDDNEELVVNEDEAEIFDEKTNILVLWFIILFIINQAISISGSISSLIDNELQYAELFNSSVYLATSTIYLTICCINTLLFKIYNKEFGLQLKRLCSSKYNYN
jgi:hypothetical protein